MGEYYDFEELLKEGTGAEAVAKYYRASDFFYRIVHAKGGGSIHMGLSEDGEFKKEDFLGQAKFIEERITGRKLRILEIGAGKVMNTKYLAKKFSDCQFVALDLPNRNFLKTRVPKNVKLVEGDYNDLSQFYTEKFDFVFGIETVCHAESKEKVVKEIAKVLRPGGELVLFDVYERKKEMSEFERKVSAITLAAMRVTDKGQYIGEMKKHLERNRFCDIEIADFTEKIRPSLRRLDRVSGYYFRHPKLLRILKKAIAEDATMNSIAGWLMLLTFGEGGVHEYCRVVAKREKSPRGGNKEQYFEQARFYSFSLAVVAEGVDGGFVGGFGGGVEAEDETDQDRGSQGNTEDVEVDIGGERGGDRDEEGQNVAED